MPHDTGQHATQAGTRFTYLPQGWVDLSGWLYIKTVHLSADSHPS